MVGISVNKAPANQQFAAKLGVKFPLLSDTTKTVAKSYGVLYPLLRIARRATFVIDRQGIVRHLERGRAAADPERALEAASRLA